MKILGEGLDYADKIKKGNFIRLNLRLEEMKNKN